MKYVEPIRNRENIEIVKRILKQNGMRNYLLFLIGINSGLRISDILRLKVCDVSNKDYIEIIEKKQTNIRNFQLQIHSKII